MKTCSLILGVCLLIWISLSSALAQETPEPFVDSIYYNPDVFYLKWLPDGSGLTFADTDGRYFYSLASHTLTPYNAAIPDEILAKLQKNGLAPLVLSPYDGSPSSVYVSPNSRFAAYAADTGNPDYYTLAITDLSSGEQSFVSRIKLFDIFYDDFEITWSPNSSALLVKLASAVNQVYYYVGQIQDDLDEIDVIHLSYDEYDPAQSTRAYFNEVYDIDSTGQFLVGQGADPQGQGHGLLILDIKDFSVIEIVPMEDWPLSAVFEKPGDLKITYVTNKGVFEYDRLAKTSCKLTDKMDSSLNIQVAFSPDGRYAAALYMTEPGNVVLREIDPP